MLNTTARTVLTIASLVASQVGNACSCAPRDVPALYRDSGLVYLAEVSSVRLVTRIPRHNARATYEIELRPLRLFKGRDPGMQKARYASTYHDMSPKLPRFEDEQSDFVLLDEIVVSSCDEKYQVGEVFLILKKQKEPLGTVGYCSRGFVRATEELLQILEGLQP
jgi:hypothetical protein